MAGALDGLRVLDFSRGMAGALVGMILADFGAEVVKVEPPEGDPTRGTPSFYIWQRGKKSVVADLRTPEGRATATELAGHADILLHNFRPRAVERFGLGYAELAAANPGLVYCAIGGLGLKGKYAEVKGYEALVAAKAGMMPPNPQMVGRPGPAYLAIPAGSYSAAQHALMGILAALYERGRSGLGQRVRTSLLHGVTSYDPWEAMVHYLSKLYGDAFYVAPNTSKSGIPMQAYAYSLLIAPSKDGYWFQFANARPHMWKAFLKALDLMWVFDDSFFGESLAVLPPPGPQFVDEEVARRFWELLLNRMREKTRDEWIEIFLEDDDIGFEVFWTTQEAMDHPQYRISRQLVEFDDPRVGRMRQLGPLAVMDGTPAQVGRPAPDLGEHSEGVLREWTDDLTPRPPSLRGKGVPTSVAPSVTRALGSTRASDQGTPFPPREGGRGVRFGPLAGVTILEIATYFAAPYGLALLADLGARVIKIEPLTGDPIRMGREIPEAAGVKVTQGKESLAVDLYTEEGRQIVYDLAAKADLVMCNWRQGVAQKLKVDDLALRAINPNLVYLYGTSYGTEGPYARRPVYAPTATAVCGQADYQAGGGTPPAPGTPLTLDEIKRIAVKLRWANGLIANGDSSAALGVGTAMLLGLIARERTGVAQRLMTTMIGSNAYVVSDDFLRYEGKPPRPRPDADIYGMGPTYRLYETRQGWVFLACVGPKDWTALCAALAEATGGGVDLAADPRFGSREARAENAEALVGALSAAFCELTAADWEDFFLAREVACVEVNTEPFAQFLNEGALMRENDLVAEVEHPIFGRHPRLGPTVEFSRTPGAVRPAPTVGQHTRAILAEIGYPIAQIDELAARAVIGV